ncbi:MAG: replication-relaxation family protein [Anaerolineae bacterium]|nr:replication-relaxation family protein [Anaerolineae bacterium]
MHILRKVCECRWLSTRQIKRYFFPDTTDRAVNKRLRLLVDARYLFCDRSSRTDEYFFRIGTQGHMVLDEAMNGGSTEICVPRRLPSQLEHFAKLNDIRFYCETACKRIGAAFEAFWVDQEIKGVLGNDSPIVPDALWSLQMPGRDGMRRVLIAFEYAHTETVRYFGSKVKRYNSAVEQGLSIIAATKFRVAVLADTRQRIVQLVRHYLEHSLRHVPFLFGAFDDLEKHGDILADIFIDPHRGLGNNGNALHSLIDVRPAGMRIGENK